MITAIFTAGATKLTIETTEQVNLEQMGPQGNLIQLTNGTHTRDVGAGVFKVVSKEPVTVTSSSARILIEITPNNKDDTFPDQTILAKFGLDIATTRKFFLDGRSIPAPR
jgi:hypothetical protein